MTTETFDDKAAFLAALHGKPRTTRGRSTRPDIPSAPRGEGDRLGQIARIAVYGYSPRWDADVGFSFWHPASGARTTAHERYAAACIAAEAELSR
jgi:hypothetical protein